MKVSDIDKVNHLIAELNGVKELRMPSVPSRWILSCSSNYQPTPRSACRAKVLHRLTTADSLHRRSSLPGLQRVAIEELDARRRAIIAELATLGVEAGE